MFLTPENEFESRGRSWPIGVDGGEAPRAATATKPSRLRAVAAGSITPIKPDRARENSWENAARALCRFRGFPEDALTQGGQPIWMSYLEEVAVVVSAAASVPAGKREHIPVRAYHMLRSLSREAINTQSVHGFEEIGLVQFLVSRGLAVDLHGVLTITAAGEAMGEIEDDR